MESQIKADKRQETMNGDNANNPSAYPIVDGEVLAGNNVINPSMPDYNINAEDPKNYKILAGYGAENKENKAKDDGAKRAEGAVPKDKYGLANNRYENNENHINTHSTASITVILPYPSKF